MLRLDVSMLDSLQSGGGGEYQGWTCPCWIPYRVGVSVKIGRVHVGFPTEWGEGEC